MTGQIRLFLLTLCFSLALTRAWSQPVAVVNTPYLTGNVTWVSDTVYLIKTHLTVMPGASLTICPGTTVKFDTTSNFYGNTFLRVARGGKIYADGESATIVFTSAQANPKPGDWLGVGILGFSPEVCNYSVFGDPNSCSDLNGITDTLSYFGEGSPDDTSGVFRYVRIEYAGALGGSTASDATIDAALFLGGVGRGTVLDHIEVYRSSEVGILWVGGTVNASHLIATQCGYNDFRFTRGYQGNLQFLFSTRDPQFAVSGAGSLRLNSTGSGFFDKPVISNVTVAGPAGPNINPAFGWLLRVGYDAQIALFNSILSGSCATGFQYDGGSNPSLYLENDSLEIKNTLIAGPIKPIKQNASVGPPYLTEIWFNNPVFQNIVSGDPNYAQLVDPFNLTKPNPLPAANSPIRNKASFNTHPRLTDAFFKPVDYLGAFGDEDWTYPWASWHQWSPPKVSCLDSLSSPGGNELVVQVSPQPAGDWVKIKCILPESSAGVATVNILDMHGRAVPLNYDQTVDNQVLTIMADVSSFPSGMYVVWITGSKGQRGSTRLMVGR